MAAYDYPLLLRHLLVTPLANKTPKQIVYRDRVRYGYATLRERIGRLASALERLGVGFGDTVAVMDWDSHRYLECYFAVPMMGATLQTVNVRLSPEQVQYCIDHAGAKVLLCNTDFAPLLEQIKDKLPRVETVVWLRDDDRADAASTGGLEYETLVADGDPYHTFGDFDENTRATLFYTTGTTGLPKGVFFSHRQLVLHTLALVATVHLTRADTYMPLTPMFHVHAWGMPFAATLSGCTQVYPGRYAPDRLLRHIRDEGVTFTHCVPTVLQMLLSAPDSADFDLSGVRMIIGGSALPRALCEAALARGIDIVTGYGMSETCPILAISRVHRDVPHDRESEIATRMRAGQTIPLVDVRVVDFNMNDVSHDGVAAGEIVARAPWLTKSYFQNDHAGAALWEGGYLHTQDIGTITPDGYVQITDRLKDVIKTGGEWVSSLDLESIISRHPGVTEVAVIGVPDDKWGERPCAFVVAATGSDVTADDVKKHVLEEASRGAISKFAVPERIVFVDALPKTSVGKLDKKQLRQLYALGHETTAADAPASTALR